ncbi:MAG: ABC-F family ATP-binding cassette domain-containing protein [Myxococcota bacterium]
MLHGTDCFQWSHPRYRWQTPFEGLELQFEAHDRIGLIGPNGSGKTSLLRLINGEVHLDSGSLSSARRLRIGYLPQQFDITAGTQLLDFVRQQAGDIEALQAAVKQTEEALHHAQVDPEDESGKHDAYLMELSVQLAEQHEQLAHFEDLYADHVALRILAGLGFSKSDAERDIGEFSGGWQMRAMLAGLLFSQPDLLLLDEPTNHLDMPSVAWLGSFLKRYRSAFVLICHDREFLNEQISRVVSFEPEGIRSYHGNYEQYLTQRAEEERVLENRHKNLERERQKTQEFIDRFRAQATKAKAVQSRIKALEKMEKVQILGTHQSIRFKFPPTKRSSKQVLSVEGLKKSYGDHVILGGVNLNAMRGEKIGVIGVNGAGKTTLLKILAGETQADTAEITYGHHVNVGYYAQHHLEILNMDNTVYEEISQAAKDRSQTEIRSILGTLLFTGDDVDKKIAVLSGGERARVSLARLLIGEHNLIFMDEPTNHLDLLASERLAEALKSFDGTLVFVSHNRSFLRQLATRIWNVAQGDVETYPGSLDEYMQAAVVQREPTSTANTVTAHEPKTNGQLNKGPREDPKARKRREAQLRQTLAPLRRRVAELETQITRIEALQKERSEKLADVSFYAQAEQSAEVTRAYQEDATRLDSLATQWEAAQTELEKKEANLQNNAALC